MGLLAEYYDIKKELSAERQVSSKEIRGGIQLTYDISDEAYTLLKMKYGDTVDLVTSF